MKKPRIALLFVIMSGLIIGGCENAFGPDKNINKDIDQIDQEIFILKESASLFHFNPPPSPLVNVNVGDKTLNFWPYTGTNLTSEPQDPINLIFFGEADPRDIRAALLSLDGDRSALGFPGVPPFNLTWDDAIGDVQNGYGESDGWSGSCIQLSCGAYEDPRFHIRLFRIGQWTVANVHFEVLIPGTTDHQVLSWELGEQFVMADFIRSGLLDTVNPVIPTEQINDAPFRTIPDFIYNELPTELRVLIGGPTGDVSEDVPIGTDGHATILCLAEKMPRQAEMRIKDFVINYNQVVPKPFCSTGPDDYIYVEGPVQMTQTVRLTDNGVYTLSFIADATISVTPINPVTGEPLGEPLTGKVRQRHSSVLTDWYSSATGMVYQKIMPLSDPRGGRLFTLLKVNSRGNSGYFQDIWCGSEQSVY